MIDVHYWPTPNGWKVTILLEECGLPYNIVPVDICLLYTSTSPRDLSTSRMPSSA